ncbi:hypothetical protein BXZ70DRAFT_446412 [Cristinia sonorae]|uniref:Uncharacterized protein n=1 Tax=Cristinia sonorae TaxID=1940300 RepID=A0A8K0UJ70_9AGAR|nr:hypothetical protein BXZ70DRAFT_446412 [Cristinia sonorae]
MTRCHELSNHHTRMSSAVDPSSRVPARLFKDGETVRLKEAVVGEESFVAGYNQLTRTTVTRPAGTSVQIVGARFLDVALPDDLRTSQSSKPTETGWRYRLEYSVDKYADVYAMPQGTGQFQTPVPHAYLSASPGGAPGIVPYKFSLTKPFFVTKQFYLYKDRSGTEKRYLNPGDVVLLLEVHSSKVAGPPPGQSREVTSTKNAYYTVVKLDVTPNKKVAVTWRSKDFEREGLLLKE